MLRMKYLKSISTKAIICYLLLSVVSCGQPDPIVITNKRKTLRTRILGGEIYFTTMYTANNGDRTFRIEQQDVYQEWEVGDTIGYGNKIEWAKGYDR